MKMEVLDGSGIKEEALPSVNLEHDEQPWNQVSKFKKKTFFFATRLECLSLANLIFGGKATSLS